MHGWAEAFPLKDKTNACAWQAWATHVVPSHGAPEVLITDNGQEFKATAWRTDLKQMSVEHRTTTPAHPQSNGRTERFNSTLKELLAKSVNNYTPDWQDRLGDCLAAYRVNVSDVTGHMPFFSLYGRRVRTPLTRLLQPRNSNHFGKRLDDLSSALQTACHATADSRKYNRQQLAKRADAKYIHVGDTVLLKAEERLTLTSHWDPQWEVVRVRGPVLWLRQQQSGKLCVANREKVKLVDPHLNFRVCVCWLAVCHAAQMPFMLTDNVPNLLSDGLLITRASDIHVRRETYTVLVVIDPARMEERLNELRLFIEKLGTHQNYSRTTRNVWEQRIRDMEATMTPPSQMLPNTRIERGLFNFVGEIGATLFGTATEDQVAQLKHHITKAQRTNRRIVHATNKLISVADQTRAEVSLNRQHLVAVEQFAKELYAELVTYRRVLDWFVGSLIALEESTQIDRILSALESVHNLWLRESDRYQRRRASLELGQLTEEILPPNELMLILENSQGVGLFSVSLGIINMYR